MKEYTSFEILGPIMVGPSSSHTAGACKIGRVAAKICPKNYESVDFYLHGSFAYTYKGHGTDKALLGGIMGFETFDDSIRDAYKIADARGINYKFIPTNLGEDYHPNTVKVVFN
ncbi:MAG: L-serine ammonia-lyase, iron-sulfur-dependent subunit beta, partial [Peptoniphilus lacydonensis]|nr:L-serine ammonia-lyase, iron-sulfur-dependent subunit beta [Peptoniphilus lacydonensis]